MSAETLRRAANRLRTEDFDPRDEQGKAFKLAVADLLNRVADDWAIAEYGYWSTCAEAIARTYLGES